MMASLQRDRWVAYALLVGLAALFIVVLGDFRVGLPEFPHTSRKATTAESNVPPSPLRDMFGAGEVPPLSPPTNAFGLFYTTYFLPPPPKAPTTRKVDVVYMGMLEAGELPPRAFVRIDQTVQVLAIGSNIVADLAISEISRPSLVVTNRAGQTNLLAFNRTNQLEVPVP